MEWRINDQEIDEVQKSIVRRGEVREVILEERTWEDRHGGVRTIQADPAECWNLHLMMMTLRISNYLQLYVLHVYRVGLIKLDIYTFMRLMRDVPSRDLLGDLPFSSLATAFSDGKRLEVDS